jgi:carbamoyltransferase
LGAFIYYDSPSAHETGAAIVRDGRIVAAINEDRITGVKHDGNTPFNSIKEVLRVSRISPAAVDAVAIPFDNPLGQYVRDVTSSPLSKLPRRVFKYPYLKAWDMNIKKIMGWFGITAPIYYVNHHLSHAAAAYYTSGYPEATVLTVDGIGDGEAATVYKGSDGVLTKIASTANPRDSPGFFYLCATAAIGFKPNDGEGKTMGLACYGNPDRFYPETSGMLSVDGLQFRGDFGQLKPVFRIKLDDKKFSIYRYSAEAMHDNRFLPWCSQAESAESINQDHKDVAAAAQRVLEERGCEFVKNAVARTGCASVALGGGVALNCKMNQRIRQMKEVKDVFIHPNPGDSGIFAGAALYVCHELSGKYAQERMEHVYFGTEYSNEEVEKVLAEYGLAYEKVSNPDRAAADMMLEGKVVGWFQGRLEYGPRALGNRSVVADPRVAETRDRINKHLKRRDWFMPFAPSMLNEGKERYLMDPVESPYMIMGFDVPNGAAKDIPAVVHVDNTVRPHTVKREVNPRYYGLIKNFADQTGVSVILNTSFNKHGLPMIRAPSEAVDHLIWGCIDELVINDFVIHRKFR